MGTYYISRIVRVPVVKVTSHSFKAGTMLFFFCSFPPNHVCAVCLHTPPNRHSLARAPPWYREHEPQESRKGRNAASGARVSQMSSTVTVSKAFRGQLQNLMATLRATEPHYIKCIKPNNVKAPGGFRCVHMCVGVPSRPAIFSWQNEPAIHTGYIIYIVLVVTVTCAFFMPLVISDFGVNSLPRQLGCMFGGRVIREGLSAALLSRQLNCCVH